MVEEMDRRDFLRLAAGATAVVALGGAAGCAGKDAEVETPSFTFGEETGMSTRVLVAYATGKGSTAGVAEAIGEELGARGFVADVKPMSACSSLDGYDAAIIGSAINGGQWLPEAKRWLDGKADALGKVPVAAFCVHGMNAGTDARQTARRTAYLDAVRTSVKLVDEGYFLGEMGEMNGVAKLAFKAFGGAGEGDMRDWGKIREWAERVAV